MTDSSVDALAGLRHEHLLYFARRAYEERRRVSPRRYGVSSNAMVDAALGLTAGVAPSLYPVDQHDLAACELAYESAPSDLQPLMLPTLERFRRVVAARTPGRGVEWTVKS